MHGLGVSADSYWISHKEADKGKDKIRHSQEQKDKDKDKTPEASKWTGGGLVLIALGLATIET